MTNTIKTIIITVVSFIFIIIICKLLFTYKDKPFSKVNFYNYHHIYNSTNKPYLDTIVESGLQSLKIDTVTVIIEKIKNTSTTINGEDIDLEAYIVYYNDMYYIFIGDYDRNENITILSHELIHLRQYYDKTLVISKTGVYLWLDEVVDISDMNYNDRPWEVEAFSEQSNNAKNMKNILYK